ncbi:MAG: hypothetical protein EBZ49_00110 [Proteobacteria bacterium]|nr:hypothetical protein [Pseudomonadota bacterium]
MSMMEFIFQIIKSFGQFQGMQASIIASTMLTLLISSIKVSPLSGLWDRLGQFKVLAAPIMSMAIAALAIKPFSMEAMMTAFITGAGSVAVHEFLSAAKSIPGMSKIADMLESLLDMLTPKK